MKNRKGYTLVEVLGVVLILGLMLLIGIPAVTRYIRRGENVFYTSLEKEMKAAGIDYLNTYRSLLPRQITHSTVISLSELVENNYIEEVKDQDGNICTGQVVATKIKTEKYEYNACLKCGNKYETKDSNCIRDDNSETGFINNELENSYEDSEDYKIVVDEIELTDEEIEKGYKLDLTKEPAEYIIPQGEAFKLPSAKVLHKENGNWVEIEAEVKVSPKEIDTNKLGTTKVIYYYHGAKTEIKVIVVDKVSPTKPEVVIRYEDMSGSNYKGNWYSGKLYVEYKSTDYTKQGVMGSGISNYKYSLDGENYIEVRKDNDREKEYVDWNIIDANASSNKIIPKDGEYIIHVKAVDKSGNESEDTTYVVRIDTKEPGCELIVTSGDIGTNNWYKSKITVGYKYKDESISNILTNPIKYVRNDGVVISGNETVEVTTAEQNLRVYATLTDEAGNVNICELKGLDGTNRVKVDPVLPKIVAKNANTYVDWGTSAAPTTYFTITPSISGATTECKVDSTVITNINQLSFGVNTLTCTVTSGSDLTATTSTTVRHRYTATPVCSGGRTLSNGNCTYYYSNNEGQCGCGTWKSCPNSACAAKSCPNSSCSCAQWKCTINKTCTEYACATGGTLCGSIPPGCSSVQGGEFGWHVVGTCSCGTEVVYRASCNNAISKTCNSYNSCQNAAACGYESCRNSSCGCESANSCTKTENGYRSYTCPSGGSLVSGTTTCQF